MKKNDEIILTTDGFTAEGSAVGHYEGMAVFVAGAAPGETVKAHIIKVKKTYAVGTVKEIMIPSPSRIPPDCAVFSRCGGCCFRHITYEEELRIKKQRVDDAFARLAGIDIKAEEILPSPLIDGYRNKAMLPVGRDRDGRVTVGFFSAKSHRVIPCESCRLHKEIFHEAAKVFTDFADRHSLSVYDEETGKGLLRHLYIRFAEKTGQLLVCPVIHADSLPNSEELVAALKEKIRVTSVMLNINKKATNVILGERFVPLYGPPYIEDILCGCRIRISPASFYQVNRTQAESLYRKAAEFAELKKDETLLDLYCGAGTIGLSMADRVRQVIGAEIVPEAIGDAKQNAALNGITNARFLCADAAEAARLFQTEGIRPDVIVLDPPRKGCSPELIQTVCEMVPKRVVYVSCDPATLARDAKLFAGAGYETKRLCAADMFPRTGHMESVALIARTDPVI